MLQLLEESLVRKEYLTHTHPTKNAHQTIAIIPEIVLLVEVLQRQLGILAAHDDFIPQNHLIDCIRFRLVFGRQIDEQLLNVPVEKRRQIRLKIERKEAEIEFVMRHAVVSNALSVRKWETEKMRSIFDKWQCISDDNNLHDNAIASNLYIGPVVQEDGGQKA